MADPGGRRDETADALALVAREAQAYVDQIDSERVLDHDELNRELG